MAVNVDYVHLFIEYPPKYSVSWIAKWRLLAITEVWDTDGKW